MISATRKWLRRNRTPFAIGIGVLGVGYVATQYVVGKISDARDRMSSERIARENLRRRFEQNQEDCTFTVLALLPTATDNIMAELETERITFELQQQKAAKLARSGDLGSELGMNSTPPSVTDDDGRSMISLQSESGVHASQIGIPSSAAVGEGPQDGGEKIQKARKSKLQLWNDLKISSITRAFTLLYTLSLLTLLTRIQLNLLGRRSYLSSVVSLAHGTSPSINLENHDDDSPDQAYGNDFETNRQYLTFSWWLLHRGWKDIMSKVETAVKEVFGNVSIRDDVSMERFSELVLEVRRKFEGATEKERQETRWLRFLLPPKEEEEFVLRESGMTIPSSGSASPLRRLLDETSDLIDSPPFSRVLTLLLDAGYSTLVDSKIAQQAFKVPVPTPSEDNPLSGPRVVEVAEGLKAVKLPVVLAVLTKQAHSIGNGVPNEYLQSMEQVRELEAFAAVVYSCNWEAEVGAAETGEESGVLVDREVEKEGLNKIEDSVVDVGTSSTFESAWGKAVEKSS